MLTSRKKQQETIAAGFISSKEVAADIRYALSLIGFTENTHIVQGGIEQAKQYCIQSASPSLLIVDISNATDPVAQLDSLANHVEPGVKVIAIGTQDNVELYRALMDMGLTDYLTMPLHMPVLEDTLKIALNLSHKSKRGSGRLVPVIGTKGGCGVTTITAQLGHLLATHYGCKTMVADLDTHTGDMDLLLNTEAGNTLEILLGDEHRAESLLIEHINQPVAANLSLLKSFQGVLNPPQLMIPEALSALNERLCEHHNMLLWDTPLYMLSQPAVQTMVMESDVVVIVLSPTIAGARGLQQVLSLLQGSEIRTVLVVNRTLPASRENIDLSELQKLAGKNVDLIIPHKPKATIFAADSGIVPKRKQIKELDMLACNLIGKRQCKNLLSRLKKR